MEGMTRTIALLLVLLFSAGCMKQWHEVSYLSKMKQAYDIRKGHWEADYHHFDAFVDAWGPPDRVNSLIVAWSKEKQALWFNWLTRTVTTGSEGIPKHPAWEKEELKKWMEEKIKELKKEEVK